MIDPDNNGYDEPQPQLDNDESTDDSLKERYGSANDTTS